MYIVNIFFLRMIFQRYIHYKGFVRHCTTDFLKMRDKYYKLEKCWEAVVDLSSMSNDEVVIHKTHNDACSNCYFSYIDPISGEKIFTRYYHFLNGKCCGEACRHCTYNYSEVPDNIKNKKKFNSSFWIDSPQAMAKEKEFIKNLKDLIKVKPKSPS